MTGIYYKTTIELLNSTASEDWQRIADQTGLKFAWIRALALGKITDPSVNKIEILHLNLTGTRFPAQS